MLAMRPNFIHPVARRLVPLTLAACVVLSPSLDARTFTTARELQVTCTSNWGNRAYYEMYAACRAYVVAVADTLLEGSPPGICPADHVNRGQLAETVMRAFGARLASEEREPQAAPKADLPPLDAGAGSAAGFVRDVLVREFPCE